MEQIRTAYLSAAQSLNQPGRNRIRSSESVEETFVDQRQSIVEELINTTDGNLTKHIKMVTDKVADKVRTMILQLQNSTSFRKLFEYQSTKKITDDLSIAREIISIFIMLARL